MENTFLEDIKDFEKITASQAEELFTKEDVVIFIGRATCPFCRKFAPKISAVAKSSHRKVYFIDSEDTLDVNSLKYFRQTYSIPTVPGLIVAKNGSVKVVCDSSLNEEEITAFIQ
ncbi:thioredoxin domain-containing protein [Granulicatella seriolae]|uniref:Thioredoxin domain-containing protein n=1 Tax=Granulicatella seriolae TaxID=2967226 RepID=A0ABT1WMS4_9LACT|nr:thioredoxin domain-containing protein [Granulicatella seriolae]